MQRNLTTIEKVLKSELREIGYYNIKINNEREKQFDVIAESTLRSIFILVVICLVSDHLKKLTKDEIQTAKEKAGSIKKEPWAAIVTVNDKGELADRIKWKDLSGHHLVG